MSKVWYASYGSNMLYARFMYYIKGGIYPLTGKPHDGCTDDASPTESRPIIIPCEMYFGHESKWWDYGGVAFLDINKPYRTIGRAYLVTDEQFKEIRKQEGKSGNWYDQLLDLGKCDGYRIRTFTNSSGHEYKETSQKYLQVIEDGIKEMFNDTGNVIVASEINIVSL